MGICVNYTYPPNPKPYHERHSQYDASWAWIKMGMGEEEEEEEEGASQAFTFLLTKAIDF
jgi:hypothetical protein